VVADVVCRCYKCEEPRLKRTREEIVAWQQGQARQRQQPDLRQRQQQQQQQQLAQPHHSGECQCSEARYCA
jgi:hypothetical protein